MNQILDMLNFNLYFLKLMIVIYVQVHFNVHNVEILKYFNFIFKINPLSNDNYFL